MSLISSWGHRPVCLNRSLSHARIGTFTHRCLISVGVLFLLGASSAHAQPQQNRPLRAEQLYQQHCLACHGSTGGNGSAASLLDEIWVVGGRDEDLARAIRDGVPDAGMPDFGGTLSEEAIRSLVIYLRELRAAHGRGETPLTERGQAGESLYRSAHHAFEVQEVLTGLEVPWSLAFLPSGEQLIVERPGRLRLVREGKLLPEPIAGTPAVFAQGQGGLLEVALHPAYAVNGYVYLALSDPGAADDRGRTSAMTRVVRGRIRDHRWVDEQVIYQAPPETYRVGQVHFGTRLAFDDQGYLFFAIGDRGTPNHAQDLARPNGKIHRIHDDGRVPEDNPFVHEPGALPTIWSFGHRNPQGLVFRPHGQLGAGQLFSSEHGPRGGDELNLVQRGLNYGWPRVTFGMNYNGTPITEHTHLPGMEPPITHWTPSIAVIGIDFYQGAAFPKWEGDLLVSAIASGNLRRVRLDAAGQLLEDELLFADQGRLRHVVTGPDGLIYVLTTEGRLLRLVSREP